MKKLIIPILVFLLCMNIAFAAWSTNLTDFYNDGTYNLTDLAAKNTAGSWVGLNGNVVANGENICTASGWNDLGADCGNVNYITDPYSLSGFSMNWVAAGNPIVDRDVPDNATFTGSIGAMVRFSAVDGGADSHIIRAYTGGTDIFISADNGKWGYESNNCDLNNLPISVGVNYTLLANWTSTTAVTTWVSNDSTSTLYKCHNFATVGALESIRIQDSSSTNAWNMSEWFVADNDRVGTASTSTPTTTHINMSIPTPSVSQHYDTNTVQINLTANITDISSFKWANFTLFVNQQANQTKNYTLGRNVGVNFTLSNLGEGIYNFTINGSLWSLTDVLNYSTVTSNYSFTIDSTDPTVTYRSNNGFSLTNSTRIPTYFHNITINLSFFDINLFSALVNITNTTASMWSYSNTSISKNHANVSEVVNITNLDLGDYTVVVAAGDSHTKNKIKDYGVFTGFNTLTYWTEEGNVITIESMDALINIDTKKEIDRYSMDFEFLLPKDKYHLRLSSFTKIRYIEDSEYNAHFIVMSNSVEGNWIDLEEELLADQDYEVVKVNDYTYDIYIQSHNRKKFKFKSIGGLNTIESHYQFEVTSTVDFYSYDSFVPYVPVTIDVAYSGGESTGNAPTRLNNVSAGDYSFTINGSGYVNRTETVSINSSYHSNVSFNLDPIGIDIYYYDEESAALITGESFNTRFTKTGFSWTNATVTQNPYNVTTVEEGTYDIRISSANYPQREFTNWVIDNKQRRRLNAYLINNTDGATKTFTVKDSSSDDIEGVTVTFKRFIGGTWTIIAEEETDFAGKVTLDLSSSDIYNINFTKLGYSTKIINLEPSDASYTIYLDSDSEIVTPIVDVINVRNINYNLSYTNDTKTILFEWNDIDGYADVYGLNITDGNNTYYSNYSTGSSGTFTHVLTDLNTTYVGVATAKTSLATYVLDVVEVNMEQAWQTIGDDSIILVLLTFLIMAFIGLFNPIASVILGTTGLATMVIFGILPVGRSVILGIVAIVVVIIIGMRRHK